MTERILNNSKKKMLSKKVNKYKLNFNYLNVYIIYILLTLTLFLPKL